MTLKELAKNWLTRHGEYRQGHFFARQDCPWCISFNDDCETCSLAHWLQNGCHEFLDEMYPVSFDIHLNLAWAICEYLANGGS